MLRLLAWLGRRGAAAIALGVFTGLLVPPLASLFQPLLVPAIVLPFLVALIRLDWRRLVGLATRPFWLLLAVAWLLVALPLIVHPLIGLLGLEPPLHAAMVLLAASPPLMASAALALLLGLDAALAILLTVLASALAPFTLPVLAVVLLGIEVQIDAATLMLRLALIVGGCFLAALALRRVLPPGFPSRQADLLDGLAVIGLLVFAIGVMDGVSALLVEDPFRVLTYGSAVFGLNVGLQALGALAFARRGLRTALTLGLTSGNGNLGLLLAAFGDAATPAFQLFVAVAQFPIYLLPMVQRRFYRRWLS